MTIFVGASAAERASDCECKCRIVGNAKMRESDFKVGPCVWHIITIECLQLHFKIIYFHVIFLFVVNAKLKISVPQQDE